MAHVLNDAGQLHLAVTLGTATRGAALTRILALRGSPGWIAGAAGVREWRYESVIEHEGTVSLVGPNVPGVTLEKALSFPAAEALPLVGRLVRALIQLSESRAGWFAVQSDSVIFTDEGGVLFLPPAIDRELRELRTFEANRDTFESLNHPDLKGATRAAFTAAAALYRVFTGRFPFRGADPEEMHTQVRTLEIQPPSSLVPGFDAEVSDVVMGGLGRSRRGSMTLSQIAEGLARWKAADLVRPLTVDQRQAALRAAESREETAGRTFRRRRFWQRNWKAAVVVGAVAVLVGVLGGTILKNVLAPRVTHGFRPAQVVEAFYSSMNTLDHTTMQACVTGSAGHGEIDEVTTLYVTSRVTQGYEGRSSIVSAADWDKAGRPPLVSATSLYGVTGLSVEQEQGPPAPVYLVRYDKWSPAPPPDTTAGNALDYVPRSEGHAVVDRVWMKVDRGDWVISKIDRITRTDLPALPAPQKPASGPLAPRSQ
jgi:uncharacterized protein YndB with AHSA1/START domain